MTDSSLAGDAGAYGCGPGQDPAVLLARVGDAAPGSLAGRAVRAAGHAAWQAVCVWGWQAAALAGVVTEPPEILTRPRPVHAGRVSARPGARRHGRHAHWG